MLITLQCFWGSRIQKQLTWCSDSESLRRLLSVTDTAAWKMEALIQDGSCTRLLAGNLSIPP
jgi:hypothetical protein